MRVLHIVTLISADGAYGGPVRVALNQCQALADLGVEVTIAAPARPASMREQERINGVPSRLFPPRRAIPRTGFAGLFSPSLLRWYREHHAHFDLVHVHLARDLVTLPLAASALRRTAPLVVQTHGMIDPSRHPLVPPLDRLLTRPILASSAAILYLTENERRALIAVGAPQDRLTKLTNGVPQPKPVPTRGERSIPKEVLFLARMQSRKRPVQFTQIAVELARTNQEWGFSLAGPDEGEAAAVVGLISASGSPSVRWEGAIAPDHVLDRLSRAAIYVLPAINEPYPVTVLEAMSIGIPVIVTDTCGLADDIRLHGCGIVTDGTDGQLRRAIRTLMENADLRQTMGANGMTATRRFFSIAAVAQDLASLYGRVTQDRT